MERSVYEMTYKSNFLKNKEFRYALVSYPLIILTCSQ